MLQKEAQRKETGQMDSQLSQQFTRDLTVGYDNVATDAVKIRMGEMERKNILK